MTQPELTKLTVNLTPRAYAALTASAAQLGDTRTDTVNRALVIYHALIALAPGEGLTFRNPGGGRYSLVRCPDDRALLIPTEESA